jgi:hypothetical protein
MKIVNILLPEFLAFVGRLLQIRFFWQYLVAIKFLREPYS